MYKLPQTADECVHNFITIQGSSPQINLLNSLTWKPNGIREHL